MIVYTPPRAPQSIPVIDLTGAFSPELEARREVAWEIHKACRETGFFYVSHHGVTEALVAAQFEWSRRFFELPLDAKLALHMKNSRTTAGYEPVGGQVLDSQDPNSERAPADLKESFYIGLDLPADHPLSVAGIRGYGHNQWPDGLPGFREQMLAYQAAMRSLGDRLLALIALSLDLPEDQFLPFYDMPTTTLRLLRYPPHPENARENQLGAGAHTDWGGITLLAQDDLGGLEVRNVADEWIEATPIPGTLVINLGDLMQRWTNDLYRSNMHRVKNNRSRGRNRHSIAFFYSPRPSARIECLPTCADAEHPPKFPPCTAGEHRAEMFKRSYGFAPVKVS
jgi:isopenicillin N synthase-like dioxygenase